MRKEFRFQQHNSKKRHYDLRIEGDGFVMCWVMYKEFPATVIEQRRLAIWMPPHKLKYLYKEGGDWETLLTGTCKLIKFERERIIFRLRAKDREGIAVTGIYALFKWQGKKWLINKIKEEGNENNQRDVSETAAGGPGEAGNSDDGSSESHSRGA